MAQMNLWREAMFRFERAIEINPGDAQAHNNLAVAYEANGDFENAAQGVPRGAEARSRQSATSRRTTAASWSSCRATRSGRQDRAEGGRRTARRHADRRSCADDHDRRRSTAGRPGTGAAARRHRTAA